MTQRFWQIAGLAGALGVLVAAGGCSKKMSGGLVANQRPTVQLSARPQPLSAVKYSVRLQWFAFDPDGRVDYFLYAIDPPADGDTTWTRYTRSELLVFFKSSEPDSASLVFPFPPVSVTSSDYHVFVLKAIDNEGAPSQPTWVAFTSTTVAPVTNITMPQPDASFIAITAPSVIITWIGQDPDGVITQKPVKYKFKLASRAVIQQALGLGSRDPSGGDIQTFFFQDAPAFASWDSLPPDTTYKHYEGLTPGQVYYFAVTSFDEAGAFEPRFSLNSNVLKFRPSTQLQAPKLTVWNAFFQRTQPTGSFDLSEDRVVRLEVAEGQPVPFFWIAQEVQGTVIAGYRWALDTEDVFNEAERQNESQTDRWSSWSVTEQSAVVGPFYVVADTNFAVDPPKITIHDTHRFYVEARDNVGTLSIMIIEMRAVRPIFRDLPPDRRRILVFDDYRGNTDRSATGYQPYGAFPTEAVLDTMLYAVGGMDYQYRPPGTKSNPGVFAGFDYDTLDYRFTALPGLPLSIMSRYNAVVWYCGLGDAGAKGDKFSSNPEGALRYINRIGQLNTLAVYLSQGGNAWLFGDGIAPAIANGYVTRFGSSPAFYPYMIGAASPRPANILWPGNFLYDYMKVRSQMDHIDVAGAGNILSDVDELIAMTPYLPDYQTPGAPYPPEGWTGGRGALDDPRVGPSSARNVGRWSGLPVLTLTLEFPDWPSPLPIHTKDVPYVSLPNVIEEPAAPAPNRHAVLDTLYLYRAVEYLLRQARDNPDGKPIWFHYSGAEPGQINWTSAPLWYFDRVELQLVADKILAQFGFYRRTDPRTWTGPGTVRLRGTEVADGP